MKKFFLAILLLTVSSCEYKADPWYFYAILKIYNHSEELISCTFFCDDWAAPEKKGEYTVINKDRFGTVFSEHNIIYSYDQFYKEIISRFPNPEIRIYKYGHFGDEDYLLETVSLAGFEGKEYSDEIPGFEVDLDYPPVRYKHPSVVIYYTHEG